MSPYLKHHVTNIYIMFTCTAPYLTLLKIRIQYSIRIKYILNFEIEPFLADTSRQSFHCTILSSLSIALCKHVIYIEVCSLTIRVYIYIHHTVYDSYAVDDDDTPCHHDNSFKKRTDMIP